MSPDDGAGGAIADRGPFLIGLMWPLAAISLVTVVLRLVFRCQAGKFNWSDVFMVFSMVRGYVMSYNSSTGKVCGAN
jgi:hypothetical protein